MADVNNTPLNSVAVQLDRLLFVKLDPEWQEWKKEAMVAMDMMDESDVAHLVAVLSMWNQS